MNILMVHNTFMLTEHKWSLITTFASRLIKIDSNTIVFFSRRQLSCSVLVRHGNLISYLAGMGEKHQNSFWLAWLWHWNLHKTCLSLECAHTFVNYRA